MDLCEKYFLLYTCIICTGYYDWYDIWCWKPHQIIYVEIKCKYYLVKSLTYMYYDNGMPHRIIKTGEGVYTSDLISMKWWSMKISYRSSKGKGLLGYCEWKSLETKLANRTQDVLLKTSSEDRIKMTYHMHPLNACNVFSYLGLL